MFAHRYFACAYWPGRYFPPACTTARGGWTGTRFASARDRRRQMEQDEEEEIALAVVLALKRLNRL